jgi:hypothetical protein
MLSDLKATNSILLNKDTELMRELRAAAEAFHGV